MPLITNTREARDAVVKVLRDNNEYLQLGFIGKDDERRLPQYPAVVVSAGAKEREIHGTHTYLVRLQCTIWVYHANMNVNHATRSDEDLILTEKIEEVLDRDPTYDGQFIFAAPESIAPGMFQPASSKGSVVIGSRILWTATSQERFK